MKESRSRLLLLAYACSPRRGSEPAVGWNRALQAARYHDVVVLCEEHPFGPEIRAYFHEQGPIPGLEFEFFPMNALERMLARTSVLYYLAYNLWHRRAARRARQLHAERPFDLVHQVNYCGFREPGYGWQLGIPFVWGPLGGAQNFPPRFLGEIGFRAGCKEMVRAGLNEIQLRFRPRVRAAVRHAATILVANTTNQRAFERAHGVHAETIVETGLRRVWPVLDTSGGDDLPSRLRAAGDEDIRLPLRILWSGQFLPFKGLSLLLKALAPLRGRVPFELRIVGDGPCRKRWRRLSDRLGLGSHVQWLGWMPHEDAQQQFGWADVFVFTSLRDTTGSVILESLAAGVPVICLDHQGGRDVITPDCGWRIPPNGPRQVIHDLRELIEQLMLDRSRLRSRSQGAVRRAEQLTWDRNGEHLNQVYLRVLGRNLGKEATQCAVPSGDSDGTPARTLDQLVPQAANCGAGAPGDALGLRGGSLPLGGGQRGEEFDS